MGTLTATAGPTLEPTAWLASPRSDRAVEFHSSGLWRAVSYDELASRVLALAAELTDRGLAGRRIAVSTANAEAFVTAFFAVLASGATCVPIVPRQPLEETARFEQRARAVLDSVDPAAVVTTSGGAPTDVWDRIVIDVDSPRREGGAAVLTAVADPARDALLQFSSGTTAAPKAIRISGRALVANVTAIRDWLRITGDDATATWLPLYHDMGLIGTMLTPIACGTTTRIMSPVDFMRRPATWLRCFGSSGFTLTASPAFAFRHAATRVKREDIADCDFSGWRVAIVGAEPIHADDLALFERAFSPFGFSADAFCPAYGLAEATLVVTGTPPATPPTRYPGATADPGEGRLDEAGARRLVSSGAPLPGFAVTIRAPDGTPVADGELGEVCVSGPSLATAYDGPTPQALGGEIATGDVGTVVEGELYVLGRAADRIKVRGRTVLAETLEARLAAELGELSAMVAVPLREQGAGVTVIIEGATKWPEERLAAVRAAASAVLPDVDVDVVAVRRGAVPRTTSGKPRRRECWIRFVRAGRAEWNGPSETAVPEPC